MNRNEMDRLKNSSLRKAYEVERTFREKVFECFVEVRTEAMAVRLTPPQQILLREIFHISDWTEWNTVEQLPDVIDARDLLTAIHVLGKQVTLNLTLK